MTATIVLVTIKAIVLGIITIVIREGMINNRNNTKSNGIVVRITAMEIIMVLAVEEEVVVAAAASVGATLYNSSWSRQE